MTYEMFKQLVIEYAHKYVPEEWKNREIYVRRIHKVNKELDGIAFFEKEHGACMSPTVYIQDMYEHYKTNGDVESAIKSEIDKAYKASKIMPPDIGRFSLMGSSKEMIVVNLINTEQNRNMLMNMPHREMEDLSVVYRWIANIDEYGIQSMMIDNALARELEMTEEDLFQEGLKNTERIFPPVVTPMSGQLEKTLRESGCPEEMAKDITKSQVTGPELYIITNEMGINGAAAVLYGDTLQTLAEELDDDLYVLPSSIHEMLAISAKEAPEVESLAALVAEANMNVVGIHERLSNQVYHYDKNLRSFTMTADLANKRLDGKSFLYGPVILGKDQAR